MNVSGIRTTSTVVVLTAAIFAITLSLCDHKLSVHALASGAEQAAEATAILTHGDTNATADKVATAVVSPTVMSEPNLLPSATLQAELDSGNESSSSAEPESDSTSMPDVVRSIPPITESIRLSATLDVTTPQTIDGNTVTIAKLSVLTDTVVRLEPEVNTDQSITYTAALTVPAGTRFDLEIAFIDGKEPITDTTYLALLYYFNWNYDPDVSDSGKLGKYGWTDSGPNYKEIKKVHVILKNTPTPTPVPDTPTPVPTATSTYTPSPTLAATATGTATATPNVEATQEKILTDVVATITAEAPTDAPTPSATPTDTPATPTPTGTGTRLPTDTPTPDLTATAGFIALRVQETLTALPTPTFDLAATKQALDAVVKSTMTALPTPTPTPTGTPTPNLAATLSAHATEVVETMTAQPTQTPTSTPPVDQVVALDQYTDGSYVTIQRVTTTEERWLVLYYLQEEGSAKIVGTILLPEGSYQQLDVILSEPVVPDGALMQAVLHADTNQLKTFEFPVADFPLPSASGSTISTFMLGDPTVNILDQISDQPVAMVDEVNIGEPGWVVLYDGNGRRILGQIDVGRGASQNIPLPMILTPLPGAQSMLGILHVDRGTPLQFDFPGTDTIITDTLGWPVVAPFTFTYVTPTPEAPSAPAPPATATFTPSPLSSPTPTATPVNVVAARLLLPTDGATVTGSTQFQWESDVSLADGETYEVIFWQQGQDPMKDGFGIAAPTNKTEISVNLSKLDDNINHPLDPGDYQWGLLIVSGQGDDYIRLKALPSEASVRYERSGGSGSNAPAYPSYPSYP